MKVNISIILVILSVCFLSCESKNKWINQYDTQADASEVAKICKNNNLECGKLWMTYQGVNFEISCGLCETGYECKDNLCRDVNECMDPALYDCPKNSTCVNEEGTYSCICKENYSGVNCVPDTRTKECKGLPENAEWNTASEITQSWNGNAWTPSTEGSYSEESSRSKCRYKCIDNYEWNGSKCVKESHEEPDSGDSGPDDDTDTADSIDDSSDSQPDDSDSTDDADTYAPDEDDTEPDEEPTTRTATCSGLPANASWNNGSSITQTFDGNDWYPPATGFYSETAVANECGFKCNQGYNWNGDWGKCFIKPAFGNICTGQTKCYNNSDEITCPASASANFYGQDAQYAKLGYCYPPSFSIKTNNSGENIVVDNYTGLEWQQVLSEETFTWENAITHCKNLSYGGYTDWKLPDPIELLPIVNHSKSSPAVDSTYFQISSDAWSSKSHNTTNALSFGSDFGTIWYRKEKTTPLKIMCVRGNKLTKPTFTTSTTNGDVVVKDSITGLIWQKTYVTSKTWQEALKYCEDLTYAGKSDWRVPNKNEQASLLNFEKSIPYSDFPDMPKEKAFWTNSTNAEYEHKTYAWHTNFSYGTNTDKKSISDPYFVVR